MRIWIGVVAIALAVGCGKNKDEPKAEADDKTEQQAPAPAQAASALWDLAPADAVSGIVLNPGSLEKLYAGLDEVRRVAGGDPLLGMFLESKLKQIEGAPIDVLDLDELKRAGGVDPAVGVGVFFDVNGDVLLVALPVRDMAALEKFMGKPGEDRDGRRVYSTGKLMCAEAGARVSCAADLAAVDASTKGGGTLSDGVPAHARGDVEIILDFARIPDAAAGLSAVLRNPGKLAVGIRLDGGVLAVTAHFAGKFVAPALASNAPSLPVAELDRDAVGLLRVHWDHAAALKLLPLPPIPPLAGFDVRKDFINQLSGEVVLATMTGGDGSMVVGVAMKDASALKKAIPALCKMAAHKLPELNIKPTKNACNAVFELPPIPELPEGLVPMGTMRASLEVRSGGVWLTAGDVSRPGGIPGASKHTAAFRDAPALVSAWGRSFDPLAAVSEDVRKALDELIATNTDQQQRAAIRAGRWILSHIAEAGYSMSFDGSGLNASLVIVTFAADPNDVYLAYEAAVRKDLAGDNAGYRSALKALAGKSDTLAGAQAAIVERGAPPIGAGSGMLAAIAIPAFVKYTEKSKMANAFGEIKRIYDGVGKNK